MNRFLADEHGASTVEWVVWTAVMFGVGMGFLVAVTPGAQGTAVPLEADLCGRSLSLCPQHSSPGDTPLSDMASLWTFNNSDSFTMANGVSGSFSATGREPEWGTGNVISMSDQGRNDGVHEVSFDDDNLPKEAMLHFLSLHWHTHVGNFSVELQDGTVVRDINLVEFGNNPFDLDGRVASDPNATNWSPPRVKQNERIAGTRATWYTGLTQAHQSAVGVKFDASSVPGLSADNRIKKITYNQHYDGDDRGDLNYRLSLRAA